MAVDRCTETVDGSVFVRDEGSGSLSFLCLWCSKSGSCATRCAPYRALEVLAAYEDTGLSPQEVQRLLGLHVTGGPGLYYQELARLDDRGRLLKLPCRVGAVVYFRGSGVEVTEAVVEGVHLLAGGEVLVFGRVGPSVDPAKEVSWSLEDFGRTVFLTYTEAVGAVGAVVPTLCRSCRFYRRLHGGSGVCLVWDDVCRAGNTCTEWTAEEPG